MRFCQSCGMPLTDEVLGTNADGSKNEDYCMYCYKDGKFLQDCTMEEMIEHCAQFVGAVNEGLPNPITKEEYIGQMKVYFPQLKRWRKALNVTNDEAMKENPALAGVKVLIAQMADSLPIAYISSVDNEGYPCTKAMLAPRKREGITTFYFTTNTFSLRVAHYKANPKASIYFCDTKGFKGMMLRGTMEVLTDAKSKEMIWREGDTQYYPGGVTDPNYCVLKFTATDGRFYSDFYPRSFILWGMLAKALVVIDIQNDITKHYRDIIGNINAAIDWAVAEGMHVVYIKHNNTTPGTRTFKPGTRGEALAPELKVVSDNIFVKTKSNALTSEPFVAFIAENGITEFYIAGADATACVKSTCFNMRKAGYTVHVLFDCVTSYDLKKLPEMLAYYEKQGCELMTLELR